MSWTIANYPSSMKHLDTELRVRAIEVANSLLEEHYEEGRAIAIVVAQAQLWANSLYDGSERPLFEQDVHVVPHPQGWAVRRAHARKASFVFPSMSEAKEKALQISREDCVNVVVHDTDGRIQSRMESSFYREAFEIQ